MKKEKLFHAHFIFSFLVLSLLLFSSCGRQEELEQAAAETFYLAVESIKETNFSLPSQALFDGESLWVLSADRSESIYRLRTESDFNQQISWREAEEVAVCLALDADKNVSLFTRDSGIITQRIMTNQGQWETKATLDCGEELAEQAQLLCKDEEGYLYLATADTIHLFDSEGKRVTTFDFFDRVVTLRVDEDGGIECMTQSMSHSKLSLYHLENTADRPTLLWEKNLSFGANLLTVNKMIWVLLRDDMGLLCSIDKENGATLAEYSLENIAINPAQIIGGWFDGENSGYFCEKTSDGKLTIHSLIEKEESEETRTELVYGVIYSINPAVKSQIVKFNMTNPDYYITIREYTSDEDGNNSRLAAELISGNGPDILDMSAEWNYSIYAKQGILEDLTPYLEGQGEDFLWSVYSPYTINGGVYMLIPHFTVRMFITDAQNISDTEKWDMDTFFRLVKENAEEKNIFSINDKENFFYFCVNGMWDQFVDVESGKADFDNETFINLLEFVDQYGDIEKDNYQGLTTDDRILSILLYGIQPMFPSSYLGDLRYYENPVVLGYPTIDGESFFIEPCRDAVAITASSSNKEGAWEFLETFLEEDYQTTGYIENLNNGIWGWSIYKSMIEESLLESRKESFTRNGKVLSPLSDEEIAQFLEIVQDADHLTTSAGMVPVVIANIVIEEVQAYFNGDKSAEMTAETIQNRVQLVLDEQ